MHLRLKKIHWAFAFTVILALLLATTIGCGPDAEPAPEPDAAGEPGESFDRIVVALATDARILDPDLDQGLPMQYRHIFSSLLTRDEQGHLETDLAEDYEVVDDRTLVFKLREDVVWHDGEPFTADDVVFTWKRMSDETRDPISTNWPRYDPWMDSIEALDDYTVQINLSRVWAPALGDLVNFFIYPEHYINDVGDEEFGLQPIGTGPYKVVDWQKDQFLKMEAHEDYFGGVPPVAELQIDIVPEAYTRTQALLAGDVHITISPDQPLIPSIKDSAEAHLYEVPGGSIRFIQFPSVHARRADTPEIEDKRVRQALNYAIDKETIAETVGAGYHVVTPGPWTPGHWAYPDNAEELAYDYDPEKARDLLIEAGYEDGFTLYLGTPVGFIAQDKEMVESMIPYFEAIGIDVEFMAYEWSTYGPMRDDNVFSAYFLGLSGAADDPCVRFYMTDEGRTRGWHDTNPEFNEIILAGLEIMDHEERTQYYQEVVFPAVIDEAPWIFLFASNQLYGVSSELEIVPRYDGWVNMMEISW